MVLTTAKGTDDRLRSITHFSNELSSLAYSFLGCSTLKKKQKLVSGFFREAFAVLSATSIYFVMEEDLGFFFLYHFYSIVVFKHFIKAKPLSSYTQCHDSEHNSLKNKRKTNTNGAKLCSFNSSAFSLPTQHVMNFPRYSLFCSKIDL